MRVIAGLPDRLRPAAARLYWQAFGEKLGRVMGPADRAQAFLESAIRGDHALCALGDGDALLGLIGFRSVTGAFAEGTPDQWRAVYGRVGALWRAEVLRALVREVDNDRFLIDGLCVAQDARGRGVGTALIEAISVRAMSLGYHELRLDVIDSNLRARALYERLGFRALRTEPIGMLRHLFGFDASTTMVRALGPADAARTQASATL
jgi:ribosomal protein S18 acetylase RimI-like enzyme